MNSLSNSQQSALAGIFSSAVLRELASKGRSPAFARLVKEAGLASAAQWPNLRAIFHTAFSKLQKTHNRNEYVYKSVIAHKLLLGKHSLKTASMLTEFRVGASKADVVVLNGTSTVYEIKSERDNLERLESQIDSYRQVFAKVNVITSENHAEQVLKITPPNVGVLLLNKRYKITTIRNSIEDFDQINASNIFSSVQIHEAKKMLLDFGINTPEMPNTLLHSYLLNIYRSLPAIKVHDSMVRVLKETRSLYPLKDLFLELPSALHASLVSLPLKNVDRFRLIDVMSIKTEDALNWG